VFLKYFLVKTEHCNCDDFITNT